MKDSWVLILVWLGLYLLDNYLTIYVASLYKAQDPQIIQFEGGYELTPQFKTEVDQLRVFGPRFIRSASITTVFLIISWILVSQGWTYLQLYTFLMGAVILIAAVVNLRHIQNLTFFSARNGNARPEGRIFYPQSMLYHSSAVGLAAHAAFFLLLALLVDFWFFAGGVCTCTVMAWSHYRLGRKISKPAAG